MENKFYNVVCKACRSIAEFDNEGKFVALHRETTHPFFSYYAELFTQNHKGESFEQIKAELAKNGDTLTNFESILLP